MFVFRHLNTLNQALSAYRIDDKKKAKHFIVGLSSHNLRRQGEQFYPDYNLEIYFCLE
jgi:hypothetical protein